MRTLSAIALVVVEIVRGFAVLAITLAIFAGAMVGVVLLFLGGSKEQPMVPDLVGMTAEEAREALEQRGLKYKEGVAEYVAETPPGRVAHSKPQSGMRVRRGREVECVLSLGSKSVKVPDVTEMSLAAAERRLGDAGLEVEEILRRSSTRESGEVIEQQPKPGGKLERGTGVVLTVSGGRRFGRLAAAEGRDYVFKRVAAVVPRGKALQRVQITVEKPGGADTVYDRVHRPGDKVGVNISGREGWGVKVSIAGERVLSTTL